MRRIWLDSRWLRVRANAPGSSQAPSKTDRADRRDVLRLESLEPRILLSADPLGTATAAAASVTVVADANNAGHSGDAGGPSTPPGNTTNTPASEARPAASDVNGDGNSDVLWRRDDGALAVWEMSGAQIQGSTVIDLAGPQWQIVNAHGDFDGDGKTDLLWQNNAGQVAIWTMDGLAAKSAVVYGVGTDWQVAGVGDFNNDGKSDILWRNSNGAVAEWQMDGTQIASAQTVDGAGNDWHVVGTANFDNDGKSDVLWRDDDGSVAVWLMDGTQVKSAQVVGNPGAGWQLAGTGNFNADSNADLLWQNDTGSVAIWNMTGVQYQAQFLGGVTADWQVASIGDYNGDGTSDVLWRRDDGATAIWQISGNGFQAGFVGVQNDWQLLQSGDFNGDGKTDLLWRDDSGAVAAWLMNGTQPDSTATVAGIENDWSIVGAGPTGAIRLAGDIPGLAESLTFDAAVVGQVGGPNGIASLTAGLDQAPVANYVGIHSALQADGTLQIDTATMQSIAGGNLSVGAHTLYVLIRDQAGASRSIKLSFILITPDQGVALMLNLIGSQGAALDSQITTEITGLVATNRITVPQTVADIGNAVGPGATADQAVTLLSMLSIQGNAALRAAATGEILTLIANNQIAAAQAMADIGATVAAGTLSADQVVALLTNMANAGGAALQAAIGGEIATLIAANRITTAQAIADLDQAITSNSLTPDRGVAVLVSMFVSNAALQSSVLTEIVTLVAQNQITAAQAVGDFYIATSRALTIDQAIIVLMNAAAAGNASVQAAVNAEIASLIPGTVTVADAVALLGGLAANGDPALDAAVANTIWSLINGGQVSIEAVLNGVLNSGALTNDQLVAFALALAADAPTGPDGIVAVLSIAAGFETLIGSAAITPAQAIAAVVGALGANQLTADQAVALLVAIGASGAVGLQVEAGSQIAALIQAGDLSAADAASIIAVGVGQNGQPLAPDTAFGVLLGMAISGDGATVSASVQGMLALAGLAAHAASAISDIDAAVVAQAITADQAIIVLAALAGAGNAAVQNAVAGEIYSLIASNRITAAAAFADLSGALASTLLTADQAAAVFVDTAGHGDLGLRITAGAEIAALIAAGKLTSTAATAAIADAVTAQSITVDHGFDILLGMAVNGDSATASAAVQAMASTVSPAAAMANIDVALSAGAITTTQAVTVLAAFASGTDAMRTAVRGEIDALTAGNRISVNEALSVLLAIAGAGTAADRSAVAGEIATFIAGNQLSTAQVVAVIDAAVPSVLTADQAVALLTFLAAPASSALQAAAGSEIAALVTHSHLTANQAVADIFGATSNGVTVDQSIVVMMNAGASGNAAVQTAVNAKIASIIPGTVTAPHVVTLLAGLSSNNSLALDNAVSGTIWSLINANITTLNSAVNRVTGAVTSAAIAADQAVSLLATLLGDSPDAGSDLTFDFAFLSIVSRGQITATQAMADLVAAVVAGQLTGHQAIIAIAFISSSGSATSVQIAGGRDIAALVTAGAISGANAASDVVSTAGTDISADQAFLLLLGMAVSNNSAASSAALAAMPGFIATANQLSAMFDIGSALTQSAITADQALGVLIVLAGSSNATVQNSATAEITSLVVNGQLTVDQTMTALLGAAATGNATMQSAVALSIGSLISSNQLTADQAMADIDDAVVASVLSAQQGATLVVNLAAGSAAVEASAQAELLSLITTGKVSAAQMASAFARLLSTGNAAVQSFVIAEVTAFVAGGQFAADETVIVFLGLAGSGPAGLQTALSQINSLLSSGQITPDQVMAEVSTAVASGVLSGQQAVTLITQMAASGTAALRAAAATEVAAIIAVGGITASQAITLLVGFASNATVAMQVALAGEIDAVIAAGQIAAASVTADIAAALSADQAIVFLTYIGGPAPSTVRTAAGTEIASLIAAGSVTAAQAMTDIFDTTNALTLDQAIAVMMYTAAHGSAGVQSAANVEIASLIGNFLFTGVDSNLRSLLQSAPQTWGGTVTSSEADAIGNYLFFGVSASQINSDITDAAIQGYLTVDQSILLRQLLVHDFGSNWNPNGLLWEILAVSILADVGASSDPAIPVAIANTIWSLVDAGRTEIKSFMNAEVNSATLSSDQKISLTLALAADAPSGTTGTLSLFGIASGFEVLIDLDAITPTQAFADITAALDAGQLNGDQAATLLFSIGATSGSVGVQVAAGAQIAALIQAGDTPATAVMGTIAVGVGQFGDHFLPDKAVGVLIGMAINGNSDTHDAAVVEMINLTHISSPASAIGDVHNAIAPDAITADQAIAVLAALFDTGDAGMQSAVPTEIYALISGNLIETAQALSDVGATIGTGVLATDQAVALIAAIASHGTIGLQVAAGGEIAALIQAGTLTGSAATTDIANAVAAQIVTADQGFQILLGMALSGNSAAVSAALLEMPILVQSAAAMTDLDNALSASAVTMDQAFAVLTALFRAGTTGMQTAVTGEIVSLIAAARVTVAQAVSNIDAAVGASRLTGDQAIILLAGIAGQSDAGVQIAVGVEIVALIQAGKLTASAATADTASAVTAQSITADQGFDILLGMTINGSGATASAAVLAMTNLVQPGAAMTDIDAAIVAAAITTNQAIPVLVALANTGTDAMQSAVVGEIDSLVVNARITVGQGMSVLIGIEAVGSAAVQGAVASEIVSLIVGNRISAAQAAADIGNAVPGVLTAEQAIVLLTVLATSAARPTMQAEAGAEISALISAGRITTAQAMTKLIMLAGAGDVTAQSVIGSEINVLIAAGQLTASQAMTSVGSAVVTTVLTADQAVTLLTYIAVSASADIQGAAAIQIAAFVSAGATTGSQMIADIVVAMANGVTTDQAIVLLIKIAAAGDADARTAAIAEIVLLARNAPPDVVQPLLIFPPGAIINNIVLDNIGATISLDILNNEISAGEAGDDITDAVAAGTLTGAQALEIQSYGINNFPGVWGITGSYVPRTPNGQAIHVVSLLAGLPAEGNTALEVAIADSVTAIINAHQISAANAINRVANSGSGDQAVTILAAIGNNAQFGFGASGAAGTLGVTISNAIATLIHNGGVTAPDAMAATGNTVGSQILPADKVIGLLLTLAANNNNLQVPAGAELAVLIAANQVTTDHFLNGTLYYFVLNTTQTIGFFSGAISSPVAPAAMQAAMAGQLAALTSFNIVSPQQFVAVIEGLVDIGYLTAPQAAITLVQTAVQSNQSNNAAALVFFTGVTIAALGPVAAPGIAREITDHAISADQGMAYMLSLIGNGTGTSDTLVGSQITALIAANQITAAEAVADIGTGAGGTVDQAVTLLAILSIQPNAALQTAATAKIATLISTNVIGASQAMSDIGATVAAGTLTGDQAITLLTVLGGTGGGPTQSAAASEIVTLVAANEITTAQTVAGIDQAITAHGVTVDQGIAVLTSLGVAGDAAMLAAVIGEMSALVAGNQITAAQVVADIGATVGVALAADQAVTLLASISVQGSPALQAAAKVEILTLIANSQIAAAQAMTDIGATIAANALSGDQVIALLLNLSIAGTVAVRIAVANEIAALIDASQITIPQTTTVLAGAVASTTLTPAQGIVLLAYLGNTGNVPMLIAVVDEMSAVVAANVITASQVITDIVATLAVDPAVSMTASVAVQGNVALQAAAKDGILALIASNQISASQAVGDIGGAIASGALTGDQVIALLAALAGAGPGGVQTAVGNEIAILIAANLTTATQAMADLDLAVVSQVLSTNAGIAVLASVFINATGLQSAVSTEVVALVTEGLISATAAATDIGNLIGTALTADQAVAVLAQLSVQGNAAVQTAAVAELASLISGNLITAAQAAADLGGTIATQVLTAGQAIDLLARVAAISAASVQTAVGYEFAILFAANAITITQAMTDLNQEVSAQVLTIDQGIVVLAGMAAGGSAAVQIAVGAEIAALVTANQITATQATTDVGNAIGSGVSSDQMITLLAVLSIQSSALQTASISEILTLIAGSQITATQAMIDIGNTIAAGTLTSDQVIALLDALSNAGTADVSNAVINEIAALQGISGLDQQIHTQALTASDALPVLINMFGSNPALQAPVVSEIVKLVGENLITATEVATDIGNAVGTTLGAGQAIEFLKVLGSQGNSALTAAAGAELATLIASNQITIPQLMMNLLAAVNFQWFLAWEGGPFHGTPVQTITGNQALGLLIALAAAGDTTLQAEAGGEMRMLIALQVISKSTAAATVDAAVTSGALSADRAVVMLSGAATNYGGSANIDTLLSLHLDPFSPTGPALFGEIAALVQNNRLSAASAVADIIAAANSGFLSIQQTSGPFPVTTLGQNSPNINEAPALLISVSLQGNAALQAAAGAGIATLVSQNLINADQVAVAVGNQISRLAFINGQFRGLLTQDQVMSLFVNIAATGDATVQTAIGSEIAFLISTRFTNQVLFLLVDSDAMATLHQAVVSGMLPGPKDLVILSIIAARTNAVVGTAVVNEIVSLINGTQITASQAVPALVIIAATSSATAQTASYPLVQPSTINTAAQTAALGAIKALVAANKITAAEVATDIGNAVGSGLTGVQAINLLLALTVQTDTAMQNAVITELIALVAGNQVTVSQVTAGIASALAAGQAKVNQLLSIQYPVDYGNPGLFSSHWAADEASTFNKTLTLNLLLGLARQGDIGMAAAVGTSMVALFTPGFVSVLGVDYFLMVQPGIGQVTVGDPGAIYLASVISAVDSALGAQTLTLDKAVAVLVGIDAGAPTPLRANVANLVTTNQLTADQAVGALIVAYGRSSAGAAVYEIASIMLGHPTAIAQLDAAVTSGAISSSQVVTLLGGILALTGNQTFGIDVPVAIVNAVISETGTLVTLNQITATQLITDIGSAFASHAIAAGVAVNLLSGVAATGPAAARAAAVAGAAMIAQGQITPWAYVSAIVSISVDARAILILDTLVATAPSLQVAGFTGLPVVNVRTYLANIVAWMAFHQQTQLFFGGGTQTVGSVTADHLIGMVDIAAANSTDPVAWGSLGQIVGDMVNIAAISVSQAVSDVASDVTNSNMTAAQAVGVLIGMAGATTGSASYLDPVLGNYVTANPATANLVPIGLQIATFANGLVSASQVMSTLDAAVLANVLSSDVAIMLLGAVVGQAGNNAALVSAASNEIVSLELARLGASSNASLQSAILHAAADFLLVAGGQMTAAAAISDVESYASSHLVPAEMLFSVILLECQGSGQQAGRDAIATEINSRINTDVAQAAIAQIVAFGAITTPIADQILTQAVTAAWPFLPQKSLNLSSVPSGVPYSNSTADGITTPLVLAAALAPAIDLLNVDIVAFSDATHVLNGAMTAATAIAHVTGFNSSFGYIVDIALAHLASKVGAAIVAPQSDSFYQGQGLDASEIQGIHDAYNAQVAAKNAITQALALRLATGVSATALTSMVASGYVPDVQALAYLDAEVTSVGGSAGDTSTLKWVAHAWLDIIANNTIKNAATSLVRSAQALQTVIESGGLSTITSLLTALGSINAVETNTAYNQVELDLVTDLTGLYIAATLPPQQTSGDVVTSANAAAKFFQDAWTSAWTSYPLSNIVGSQLVGNAGNTQGYIKLLSQLMATGLPGGKAVVGRFLSTPLSGGSSTMGEALGLETVNGQSLDGVLNNTLKEVLGNNAGLDPDDLAASNSLLEVLENPALFELNPSLGFALVSLGSHGMVALLTMDSVSTFLSKNPVTDVLGGLTLAQYKMIADSCDLVTNLVVAGATTFVTQSYTIATDLYTVFADLGSHEDAAADAAALGKSLFAFSMGFQFQNAVTVGEDIGNVMVDLFTGHPLDLAHDVLTLGKHSIELILSNPYLQAAAAVLNTYAVQVENDLHLDVVANAFISLQNWLESVDPGEASNDPQNPGFFSSYLWGEIGDGLGHEFTSGFSSLF